MALFERHLDLGPPLRLSPWRKTALTLWKSSSEASVYGNVEIDAGPALRYLDRLRVPGGPRITPVHFVGKVVADTLHLHPEIHCVLRLGRLYPRKGVTLFFQVATDREGDDLAGALVYDAETKSVVEIAGELNRQVRIIRSKGDTTFQSIKECLARLPAPILSRAQRSASFCLYTLNLWSPLLGVPKDPFGSVMITSVASFGVEFAFAPLIPLSRVPLIVAVGGIEERGEARRIGLSCTFDHRVIDGLHAGRIVRTIRRLMEKPGPEGNGG